VRVPEREKIFRVQIGSGGGLLGTDGFAGHGLGSAGKGAKTTKEKNRGSQR
jgi:hypothetical protein